MTIQTATPRRQTRLVYRILHDMLLCTKCCMDIGRVAQLVEQVTFNHWVTGSNPVALTILLFVETCILQQIGGWTYGS